jgi:integrase/recombinase XerD
MNNPQDYRFRSISEFIYSTGVRADEALRLNVDDVSFSEGCAKVFGKGKKERVVPVGKTALRHLEIYLAGVRPLFLRTPSETAVWLGATGRRLCYHTLLRRFIILPSSSGIRVTPHVLRRSCATELLRNGASVWAVKEILGHDDLETLEHYAHLDIADLKATHARCHPRESAFQNGENTDRASDLNTDLSVARSRELDSSNRYHRRFRRGSSRGKASA